MTTADMIEARALRDGCDCPPQVERCAHFTELTLKLSRADRLPAVHVGAVWPFSVTTSRGAPDSFCDCGCGWRGWRLPVELSYVGSFHDAALAAFHEAEAKLIAGEPS